MCHKMLRTVKMCSCYLNVLPFCTFFQGIIHAAKAHYRSWLSWQMLANTSVGHGININILDDQMFIMAWKAFGTLLTVNSCDKAVIVLQEKCKSEIETESELASIF